MSANSPSLFLCMANKIIRLCYRKIIDASSQKQWEKLVFESSYTEFRMQAQFYNQEKKYTSFGELLLNVPGSERLHFLVSAAVTGYVQQLNNKIPDILNNLGKHFLAFQQYRFEIINSDINNKEAHQIAINFFSEPLIWQETVNDFLLVSPINTAQDKDGLLTDMVQLQPFLSIYSLKEETT
jgi:hypothetical protein